MTPDEWMRDRRRHDQELSEAIITMPKPRVRVKAQGIPIGSTHKLNPKTGILEPIKKKLPLNVQYAKANKKTYKRGKR